MKKLLILMMAVIATMACSAKDKYSTDPNVLPQTARTILANHFPKAKVSHIKIDKHTFGGTDYDVILTDGTEIDFDSKGNLDEVDCGRSGQVPDGLVAKSVLSYVKKSYPGQRIVKYDIKSNGYDVELQSGVEIEFDKQGRFRRIDD